MKCLSIYRLPISIFSSSYFDKGGKMSKQTFRHTLTPGGIIISDTRVTAKSNGAVGLPGSGETPLSYIEMEGMGKLWTVFIYKKYFFFKRENAATGFAVGLWELAKSQDK